MKTEFDIGEEAYLKVEVTEIVVTTDKKVAYSLTTVDKHRAIGRVLEEELRPMNIFVHAAPDEETVFEPIVYKNTPRNGYGYDAITCKKCHGEISDNTAIIDLYKFCPFCGRRIKNAGN